MSPKKEAAQVEKPSFEEGMDSLESIVARLEQGDLPLEESLASFEAGIGLLRSLHGRLGDVEKRVEVLMRDAAGVLRKEELEDPE
jgi:exodeoxyribonuclease VII small subunit